MRTGRAGEGRTLVDKAGENRAGEGRAGQMRTGQVWLMQDR